MDESWRRQLRDMADLAAQPVVEITCLIYPNGAGGWHHRGQALSMLAFTTTAWRIGIGPVRRDPLWVRRLLSEAEVGPQMQLLQAGTVLSMRARLVEKQEEKSHAMLEDVIDLDAADPELLAILAELRQPVTHQDDVFGVLTLDRQVDCYEGEVPWCGRTIRIRAVANEAGDLERSLASGHLLWADQAAWARRVCDLAVAELLPLKNECWLEQDEASLSAAAFLGRMSLESIVLNPNGTLDFYHHDGDLFWGHGILVYGTITDGPQRAEIVG